MQRIQERGDLTQDEVLYDAALRNLQTLSEATQRLPDDVKACFPNIPWEEISGLRNILVHNYLSDIDSQTVANVLQNDLELLYRAMEQSFNTKRQRLTSGALLLGCIALQDLTLNLPSRAATGTHAS